MSRAEEVVKSATGQPRRPIDVLEQLDGAFESIIAIHHPHVEKPRLLAVLPFYED